MSIDEQIKRELECVNDLIYFIEKDANAGRYELAHSFIEPLERSIRELGKLEHLKKMEENLRKLLKSNGVQIHHVVHITAKKITTRQSG